jgi:hypothetical protein
MYIPQHLWCCGQDLPLPSDGTFFSRTESGLGYRHKHHLTQCINSMVVESQLPHQIVISLYLKLIVDSELTVLWWN